MDEAEMFETPALRSAAPHRLAIIAALAILIGAAGGVIARILLGLITFITTVVFRLPISTGAETPTLYTATAWVLVIPALGAIVVGLMARFGSAAIRGHGIPEVMSNVLYGDSRIAPRVMLLKPLSAAIAIGTGGPFGAEGPVIATGGALGSVVGQLMHITTDERKTLLAAGAAAGMAAVFCTPVAAVILSIELLLFEYRAQSIIPVALSACAATAVRLLIIGPGPAFPMPAVAEPSWTALIFYVALGALIGLCSVWITRLLYRIEDAFERLPVHWMWWPLIGSLAVGVTGFFEPRVLGVGYAHIHDILSGELIGTTLLILVVLKFVAWSIYLGSGTSGGTLAPLFILGGGAGSLVGGVMAAVAPAIGIELPVAALVGMAAMFAGASHALLASIIFAFEATRQPLGLLPLLAGCSAAYLISVSLMETSIMTEKIARRGAVVRPEYALDYLSQVAVRDAMSTDVITLSGEVHVAEIRQWIQAHAPGSTHQGFPVVSTDGKLLGVLTRRDLLDPDTDESATLASLLKRSPAVVFEDNTLREAADHMVHHRVGRVPVLSRDKHSVVGIVSRSDLLSAHERRLSSASVLERGLRRERMGDS